MSLVDRKYSSRQVALARDLWNEVLKPDIDGAELQFAFAAWLGDPHPGVDGCRYLIVNTENPEVMHKIALINGPNGRAIIKMLEAQKDVHD